MKGRPAIPEIRIPMPLLVTVDDAGWWRGRDGSGMNRPFRTGMARDHVLADYQALAALGRALHMRIPAGFVICEWDGAGLLRKLPSSTWMGADWKAPMRDEELKEAAAALIRESDAYIEPALHGVGHEFWIDGKMDRTEFHDGSGGMRDRDEVEKHLDYFFRLMARYGLDRTIRLFVPPALNHCFGGGDLGFQGIAAGFGIRYVALAFDRARRLARPQYPGAAWESGVMLMERGISPVPWHQSGPAHEFDFSGPILPLHWANILDENPEKNMDVATAWGRFIRERAGDKGMVMARDISVCLTQYLNASQSRVERSGAVVTVHLDWIRRVPGAALADELFFSVVVPEGLGMEIWGAERKSAATPAEASFLKLGLPDSGKVVLHFQPDPSDNHLMVRT